MKIASSSILILAVFLSCSLFSQENRVDDLIAKGISYYKVRDIDSALYYFNLAVAADSNSAEAFFRRGLARDKSSDLEGAMTDYQTAAKLDPKPIYYNNIGIINTINDKQEDAIAAFDKALALDSTYVQAIFNKGIAYFRLGNTDEACVWVGKAKEQGFQPAEQFSSEYCQ